MCVFELSRRIWRSGGRLQTECYQEPSQIAEYYMQSLRFLDQEHIYAMFFDTKQHFIKRCAAVKRHSKCIGYFTQRTVCRGVKGQGSPFCAYPQSPQRRSDSQQGRRTSDQTDERGGNCPGDLAGGSYYYWKYFLCEF